MGVIWERYAGSLDGTKTEFLLTDFLDSPSHTKYRFFYRAKRKSAKNASMYVLGVITYIAIKARPFSFLNYPTSRAPIFFSTWKCFF